MSGHKRTATTSKGCNHWLLMANTLLKVALAGGNRSMVARTSKCGWAFTPLRSCTKSHAIFYFKKRVEALDRRWWQFGDNDWGARTIGLGQRINHSLARWHHHIIWQQEKLPTPLKVKLRIHHLKWSYEFKIKHLLHLNFNSSTLESRRSIDREVT